MNRHTEYSMEKKDFHRKLFMINFMDAKNTLKNEVVLR